MVASARLSNFLSIDLALSTDCLFPVLNSDCRLSRLVLPCETREYAGCVRSSCSDADFRVDVNFVHSYDPDTNTWVASQALPHVVNVAE